MTPAPAGVDSSRLRRLAPLLVAGAAVAAATWALHLRDPHVSGSWGFCPSALMGIDCPFCGSLRAVNLATHREWAAAASSNLLLVSAAPLVVATWLRGLVRAWLGRTPTVPQRVPAALGWAVLALVVLFTVLRNLPGSWLAP